MFADSSTRRTAAYQSLLIKEIIEEYEERVDRIKEFTSLSMNKITLSEEQEKAKQAIDNSELQTILLEGVTGSGKTMVYLKLCEEILNKGGSAIVLVPEIALTNHVISLFQTFFPDKVSLMHSGLSNANKMDEFSRIKEGKTSIVIGTRSALFAPLNNLKLIIIDEEQSDSYKQASTPFYDARTVARMRSEITGAKVIFASATPLVEDRCRAERGLYGYVRLEHKFAASSVVKAKFIDMSDLSNISPQTSSMLSVPLLEAMKRTFERHEQSMLLINRRGFSPIVKCRKCHKIMKCENCDIPLTYHKKANRLNCHRCDASNFAFSSFKCPYDGNTEFDELGYGTERIEEILKKTFPDMRIARLDRDTSQEKKRAEILDGFSRGDFDVLIGTEMIAKGHDFPNVTLSAALFADQSLSIPSYMANETTFDLICQLVGRSGRHEKEGEAFIQTYNPLNKILILAARQDYDSFYQLELENRKRFKFPPYVFMTQVTTQGPDAFQVHQVAKSVRNYLVTNLKGKKADIFGPYEPFEYKINGRYFERVLVKFKNSADVDEIFERLPIIATPAQKDVVVSIERDPRGE